MIQGFPLAAGRPPPAQPAPGALPTMPIYAYRCAACGFEKDVLQKLSDPTLTDCPSCGQAAFGRMLTAPNFQLKGTGWYVTDFRDGNTGKKGAESGEGGAGDGKSTGEGASSDGASGSADGASKPADAAGSASASSTGSGGRAGAGSAPALSHHRPADLGPAGASPSGCCTLIVSTMDQSLRAAARSWHPHALRLRRARGWGRADDGWSSADRRADRNVLGQRMVVAWESLLGRIPIVKSIYNSVKQVSDTLLSPNGQAFRKALLVEYPRRASGPSASRPARRPTRCANHVADDGLVYVPTTPNPTSGFFLMLPARRRRARHERRRGAQVRRVDGGRRRRLDRRGDPADPGPTE
jgi:putative FmdB family regulatory protein